MVNDLGFITPTKIHQQFKSLDPQLKQRILKSLSELSISDNPADQGVYKIGMKVFAYNVGKYRIIYTVDYFNSKIILHRVCDHKSVYNKD